MGRIINLLQTRGAFAALKKQGKSLVLAGGCFDLLHQGHLEYLKASKAQGDILIVALENDENVNRLKGKDRPINPEKIRAKNLLKTKFVDWVLILPILKTAEDYLKMVQTIKPDIVAVTAGDPQLKNKQKQAEIVGAKVKIVIDRLSGFSTTKIINKNLPLTIDNRA